jgi:hypothetical protein
MPRRPIEKLAGAVASSAPRLLERDCAVLGGPGLCFQSLHRILLDQKAGGRHAALIAASTHGRRCQAERGFVEHEEVGCAIRARPIASICCSPPER